MKSESSHTLHAGPLGQSGQYVDEYSAALLFPMPREEGRRAVGLAADAAFLGQDIWTGYEFSWLDAKGKPQVAGVICAVDCGSACVVESKSFKLYLNSFAQTRFDTWEQVEQTLVQDLRRAFAGSVDLKLLPLSNFAMQISELPGRCLDFLDVEISDYQRKPDLLQQSVAHDAAVVEDQEIYTHLFRSLCPVTAQPDWASIWIRYSGLAIDEPSLLRYLISYRQHQAFHETTVERMYADIVDYCRPTSLVVYGRFLRRGGLDINPCRSSAAITAWDWRLTRQ